VQQVRNSSSFCNCSCSNTVSTIYIHLHRQMPPRTINPRKNHFSRLLAGTGMFTERFRSRLLHMTRVHTCDLTPDLDLNFNPIYNNSSTSLTPS
jgi:hypothetical protein